MDMPKMLDVEQKRVWFLEPLPAVAFCLAMALLLLTRPALAESKTPREIADMAAKAVVGITAMTQWGDELSEGSGFFIDDRGTFVTNYHVIEDAYSLLVKLPGGEQLTAVTVAHTSREQDIAVLKVNAGITEPLLLDSDSELHPGDSVYVMGNPLGQERSFSNGIVSAWRVIDGRRLVQITAPISPGSSGGPVMNSRGRVVGIASEFFEGGQNLNLAVPVAQIRPFINSPTAETFQGKRIQPVAVHALKGGVWGPPRIELRGDAFEEFVREQLREMDREAKREGFTRSHDVYVSDLNDWNSALVAITLERGVSYLFGAVCDHDCADIDLFLYDTNQKPLAEDTEVTDIVVLDYAPRYDGPHFLRVRMAECSSEPCTFAVGVWRQK